MRPRLAMVVEHEGRTFHPVSVARRRSQPRSTPSPGTMGACQQHRTVRPPSLRADRDRRTDRGNGCAAGGGDVRDRSAAVRGQGVRLPPGRLPGEMLLPSPSGGWSRAVGRRRGPAVGRRSPSCVAVLDRRHRQHPRPLRHPRVVGRRQPLRELAAALPRHRADARAGASAAVDAGADGHRPRRRARDPVGARASGTRSSGTAPSSTPPTPTPSGTRRSARSAARSPRSCSLDSGRRTRPRCVTSHPRRRFISARPALPREILHVPCFLQPRAGHHPGSRQVSLPRPSLCPAPLPRPVGPPPAPPLPPLPSPRPTPSWPTRPPTSSSCSSSPTAPRSRPG